MIKLNLAIETMQKVFNDFDKDFTIWEYKDEIKELLKAGLFVRHINKAIEEIVK